MIWRIRERSAFSRLSREGRRTRAGVVWCTYVLDPLATPPRVAYALGRAVGTAVVRNRLRRQLRVLIRAQTNDGQHLPAGWYLFGVRPGTASPSFDELTFDLQRVLDRIRG